MSFSTDFLWGAATASYQIEGAAFEDGKGPSIWDTFSHTPGKVKNGDTGDVACDHYHRCRDDIRLMAELGLKAYRFSIAWPRVLPQGTGRVNKKGFDFYDRLTDELLAQGIRPCATLYHWDLPQALEDQGGWRNPDAAEWFAAYAEEAARRLGDRISCWMTFNEMCVTVVAGHVSGVHAPGAKLPRAGALAVLKNLLLAHGRGVQALRAGSPAPLQIGLAHCGAFYFPETESPEDIEACRRAMFEFEGSPGGGLHSAAIYLDPVFFGTYNEAARRFFGNDLPAASDAEMRIMSQPLDFLGLNIYKGACIGAGADGRAEVRDVEPDGYTHFNWPITPAALYWIVRMMHERYNAPVMITENGMSNDDAVGADGCVHDAERIRFLQSYLRQLRRAADEGIPLLGYLQWSLLDNFEWAEGYSQRFGLIHVDYETQKRTLKDSARWYRQVIATNGANL